VMFRADAEQLDFTLRVVRYPYSGRHKRFVVHAFDDYLKVTIDVDVEPVFCLKLSNDAAVQADLPQDEGPGGGRI
jgi:hypothetical protein